VNRAFLLALLLAACAPAPAPAASPSGASAPAPSPPGPHEAALAPPLAAIQSARLGADVARLVSFGTRHTLSITTSPTRGIGAARTWIAGELGRVPGVKVSLEPHVVPADGKRLPHDTEIVDVVGILPGAMPAAANRLYYVVAHYDSRVVDVMDAAADAPGANDDGSGVAVVLELARVLAPMHLDATVVFLLTAGEEQGLYGARAHAHAAREQHLDVRAVLNDDIVGDPSDPAGGRHDHAIRVFSGGIPPGATPEEIAEIRKLGAESDSSSRELARFVAEVAREDRRALAAFEPKLVFRSDRFLRGGDHLAFLEEGFPAAIRFTTVAETFARQHADVHVENGAPVGDLPQFVDPDYLARVASLQAAVLIHLANAPSSPPRAFIDTSGLANDTALRWEASPEPDVAGYEVVWRATTEPEWSHVSDAGARLDARVAVSKDDVLFGVRAYDRDGWRSPVTFARTK
jgi:Zn-dependent M28 family amino/carboxypeptidase